MNRAANEQKTRPEIKKNEKTVELEEVLSEIEKRVNPCLADGNCDS